MAEVPRLFSLRRDAFAEGLEGDRLFFELQSLMGRLTQFFLDSNLATLSTSTNASVASIEADIATIETDVAAAEADIDALESGLGGSVPIGTILAFAGASVPTNFLECDGVAISRITYAALYSVLGNIWGEGDGSTTFNKPDLRGKFPRGYDHGAGNDPDAASRTAQATGGAEGDNVGSVQGDASQGHRHSYETPLVYDDFIGSTGTSARIQSNKTTGDPVSDGVNGTPRISSETRPINASVMYIIKYQ